ncbi:hypothetical protein [Mycolicibacter heraklionensis]|nr:hypothetical protein [Mycolicibacter heraklionensis]
MQNVWTPGGPWVCSGVVSFGFIAEAVCVVVNLVDVDVDGTPVLI